MKAILSGIRIKNERIKNSPNLASLSLDADVTVGSESEYISDYFGLKEIENLPIGGSYVIAASVGSGKTTAMIDTISKLPSNVKAVIVTNRHASLIQIKRDVLRAQGVSLSSWPEDAICSAKTRNIDVTTYQSLAQQEDSPRFSNGTVLILDEIHYLTSDATFSSAPMRIIEMLRANVNNTKRIYISATIDETIPEIRSIEEFSDKIPDRGSYNQRTRIKRIFYMESNWNHLNIKVYDYSDIDTLVEALNKETENGKKATIFVRNKERRKLMSEKLRDCQFVYSSEEEHELLSDIAISESFSSNSLIATKVLENGVSITDASIDTVVIEEIDPVSFMQFLGRVRTKRNKPRPITIMIPDYKATELKQVIRQCYEKLSIIKRVMDNPDKCMRNYERYAPYIYYSETGPKANMLAFNKFCNLFKHVEKLIADEETWSHSHIHYILNMLGLDISLKDSQFLNYDNVAVFKESVNSAYEAFLNSPRFKENRDMLAKELIKIVSETNVYPKKITGSQLQLDKINDILACAGIESSIVSLGEAFGVS